MRATLIFFVSLLTALFFLIPASASADHYYESAVADAWIESANPNTPHPTGDLQLTYTLSPDQDAQILVKFDLSSIPAGSTVTGTHLDLYDRGCSGDMDVNVWAYRETSIWNEVTATWGSDLRYTTTGGNMTSTIQCLFEGGLVFFNVNEIVQAWINGTNNYGFRIIGESSPSSPVYSRTYKGREDVDGYAPRLTVDYTPPQGQSIPPSTGGTTPADTTGTGTTGSTGTATGSASSGGTSSSSASTTTPANTTNPTDATTSVNTSDSSNTLSAGSALEAIKNPAETLKSWPVWKIVLVINLALILLGAIIAIIAIVIIKLSKKHQAVFNS